MPRVTKNTADETEEVTSEADIATPEAADETEETVETVSEDVSTDGYDKKKAKNGVKFILNDLNVSERTFDEEGHGDDFAEVAATFYETNRKRISGVVYL